MFNKFSEAANCVEQLGEYSAYLVVPKHKPERGIYYYYYYYHYYIFIFQPIVSQSLCPTANVKLQGRVPGHLTRVCVGFSE